MRKLATSATAEPKRFNDNQGYVFTLDAPPEIDALGNLWQAYFKDPEAEISTAEGPGGVGTATGSVYDRGEWQCV